MYFSIKIIVFSKNQILNCYPTPSTIFTNFALTSPYPSFPFKLSNQQGRKNIFYYILKHKFDYFILIIIIYYVLSSLSLFIHFYGKKNLGDNSSGIIQCNGYLYVCNDMVQFHDPVSFFSRNNSFFWIISWSHYNKKSGR